MRKLEVFFDYNCPYCYKGHLSLLGFVKDKPDLEIVWHPSEISSFKDRSGKNGTDLSLQGMFFAAENNADMWKYHSRIYELKFDREANTHNIDAFVKELGDILDPASLKEALVSGKYKKRLMESNQFAFSKTGVHVVPTYRADDGFLQDRQEFYGLGSSDTGYGGTK